MKLIINNISRSTPDSVTLYFKKQFDYKAGQHAALTFSINGKEHSRTYQRVKLPFNGVVKKNFGGRKR